MTNLEMVRAFNEWMRRYIEDPKGFEAEFQTVNEFLKDEAGGKEPTYGETSAAYMEKLAAESAAGAVGAGTGQAERSA